MMKMRMNEDDKEDEDKDEDDEDDAIYSTNKLRKHRMDGVMSSPWDTLVVTSPSASCSVNHSKLSRPPLAPPGLDPWHPWVGVGQVCVLGEFSVPPGGLGSDLNW